MQGSNKIGDDGAKSIAAAAEGSSSLRQLNLVRSSLGFLFSLIFALRLACCCVDFVSASSAVGVSSYVLSVFVPRQVSLRVSQWGNKDISVAATCHIVACVLRNPNIPILYLGHEPSACVAHAAWQSEGLPAPPANLAGKRWHDILPFLRENRKPRVQVTLTLSHHGALTVPLRASLPLPRVTVSPSVEGALLFSSASPAVSVDADGRVTGLTIAQQAEINVNFSPKDGASYTAAALTLTVCVEFEQERHDKEQNIAKVHEFFSNSGRYQGCTVPFPDMDYVALCPNYFRNVHQALQSPPQVPTVGSLDAASAKLVANAMLPLACRSSKENGGLQCALQLFIRRALAMTPSPDVSSLARALASWVAECSVDVSARDAVPRSGRTALHHLAISGSDFSDAVADLLLDASARCGDTHHKLLNMKDGAGLDALEIAVDQGNVAFAAKLVRKGASFEKDFLKRRSDDQGRWQPVVDAVLQATRQSHQQHLESFWVDIFGVSPDIDRGSRAAESDPDAVSVLLGRFKPTSTPSLKNVERTDPAAACLARALALTRFPRHCALAKEARRGLRKYARMLLDSPDAAAADDAVSSESALPAPVAAGRRIQVHRWVLAVGAHISHAEHKPSIAHALLQQLQQLQPDQQLAPCEQNLMHAVSQAMRDSQSDDSQSVASQLFGQADRRAVEHGDVLKSLSEQQRAPLEALLKMIGLKRQKELGIQMFSSAQDQEYLRQKGLKHSVVDRVQNFVFAGNPGCGKTAVARLYADILQKSGIRKGNTFIQMTGAEALKKGSSQFADEMKKLAADRSKTGPSSADLPKDRFLVNENVEVKLNAERVNAKIIANLASKTGQAQTYDVEYEDGRRDSVAAGCITRPDAGQKQGGVLFIDEVYDLDPAKNPEGKLILAEIMRIAEDYRDTVSVILAGYKDDIDNKIFSFNIG